MNALWPLYLTLLTAMLLYMTSWFLISCLLHRNDIADIAWGLGFVFLSYVALSYNNSPSWSISLTACLTTVWGLRLSGHIYLRNRNKNEDFRYAQWRQLWGKWFVIRSFLQVYLLQGILLLLVLAPVAIFSGIATRVTISGWVLAGVVIWLTGFYFEAVGDWQLSRFLRSKPGKNTIMDQGLWKYTRHPNYFGEVTQWWGLWVMLTGTNASSSLKLIALAGPATITVLILFVSGIPMLEKRYSNDPAYQRYAKRTSRFFPREPRVASK